MDDIYKKLTSTIDESKIKVNESMKKHTSFKVGGNAKYFITATDIEDVRNVLKLAKEENVNLFVLGNGSNVLFKDEEYDGIVLQIKLNNIEIEENKILVEAGAKNAIVAKQLLEHSLAGFEFAAGIPGTIGGAVRMNAGAYGGEIKDILETVTYMKENGEVVTIQNQQCDFSYRHSIFCENPYIILSCTFALQKGDKHKIQEKMNEYMQSRKEKQPLEYPSAGSTFKRGKDFITAKLIDECGLKGYQIGGAAVSEKHAGFIINKDNATATDIINLIDYVKKVVLQKTGKKIELEIEIV